jgi:hypothetical protein
LGGSYSEAKKFAEGLGITAEQAQRSIESLRSLNAVGADSFTKFSTLAAQGKITAEQFAALDKAAKTTKGSQSQLSEGLGMLAFKFNNIVQSLQILKAAAQPVYDAAEAMRQYASAAERAKAASAGIFPPVPTSSTLPPIAIPQFGQPAATPVGDGGVRAFNSQAIENAVKDLQRTIEGRPPAQINAPVTFTAPGDQSDDYFKVLRSIERGNI